MKLQSVQGADLMTCTIYALRIASSKQVLSIGQTTQRLSKRLAQHIKRAWEIFNQSSNHERANALTDFLLTGKNPGIIYGRFSDKPLILATLLTRGVTIEIVKIEEIDASERVWKEQLWKARYFLQQDTPMLIDGCLVQKFALQYHS